MADTLPQIFLLLENPSKSNNLGPILRCATAFGVQTIVAVGYEKCAVQGSHGASKHVQIIAFPTVEQAVHFLQADCQCVSIVGLLGPLPGGYDTSGYQVGESGELAEVIWQKERLFDETRPILSSPSFPANALPVALGNTCLALSKDRHGLPLRLAKQCTVFSHVPHVLIKNGDSYVPLLDTQSSLSIALHHLTARLGYDERTFQGHKFEVVKPHKHCPGDRQKQADRAEERQRSEQVAEETIGGGALAGLLGDVNSGDY